MPGLSYQTRAGASVPHRRKHARCCVLFWHSVANHPIRDACRERTTARTSMALMNREVTPRKWCHGTAKKGSGRDHSYRSIGIKTLSNYQVQIWQKKKNSCCNSQVQTTVHILDKLKEIEERRSQVMALGKHRVGSVDGCLSSRRVTRQRRIRSKSKRGLAMSTSMDTPGRGKDLVTCPWSHPLPLAACLGNEPKGRGSKKQNMRQHGGISHGPDTLDLPLCCWCTSIVPPSWTSPRSQRTRLHPEGDTR